MRKVLAAIAALVLAACSDSTETQPPPPGPTAAAVPTFSEAAGTRTAPISVALASATAGAAIHFTVDGSDPTSGSSTYVAPLELATATTLKAIATAQGYTPSAVAAATYAFQVAAPTFSVPGGSYTTAQSVALATSTPGATIHYRSDGADPTVASSVYAAPILLAVPSTTTLRAVGVRSGFAGSAVQSATYTLTASPPPPPQPVAAVPTFQPASGTYGSAVDVVMASTTAGATVRYTTDGSDPTLASSVYAAAVHVASSGMLKAFATAPGHDPSAIASAAYTIGNDPADIDFLTYCTSLRDTAAALQVTCMKANPTIFPAALRRHGQHLSCIEMQGEFAAGRIVWNPVAAASCAASFASLGCSDLSSGSVNPHRAPAECFQTGTGTVANGGTCYTDGDCAGGGDCTKQDATPQDAGVCPGVCQARAGSGESCSSAECVEGLWCVDIPALGPPTCMARSGAGGSCPCLNGLWCDAAGGPMGMCMDPKTAGTCGTSPLPAEYTEAECAVGYACHNGQCTTIAGPGESCTVHPCGEGYACTAGICTAWPSPGQSCVGSEPCASGYCAAGTCAPYKARGDPCGDHVECLTGICTGGYCGRDLCFP